MSVDVRLGDKEGLDRSRRYLRPVAEYSTEVVHWSLYSWLPAFEAWVTGMSLCGGSMRQGPLPEGTAVTCVVCEEWRPRYERMLAPGYRPEDDDPEALRHRTESAEKQLRQVEALVAKWRQIASEQDGAVVPLGVAADVLHATLTGLNDLLAEAGELPRVGRRRVRLPGSVQGPEAGCGGVSSPGWASPPSTGVWRPQRPAGSTALWASSGRRACWSDYRPGGWCSTIWRCPAAGSTWITCWCRRRGLG